MNPDVTKEAKTLTQNPADTVDKPSRKESAKTAREYKDRLTEEFNISDRQFYGLPQDATDEELAKAKEESASGAFVSPKGILENFDADETRKQTATTLTKVNEGLAQDTWIEFPSLSDWLSKLGVLEVVLKVVDALIAKLIEAMALLQIVIDFIQMLKGLLMAFLNIWLTALKIILRTLRKLLKKLKDLLLFFDFGGNGVYITQYTLPLKIPPGPDGKMIEYSRHREILTKAVTTWAGRPNFEDSICGVVFLPYALFNLASFGDIMKSFGDFMGGMADLWDSLIDLLTPDDANTVSAAAENNIAVGKARQKALELVHLANDLLWETYWVDDENGYDTMAKLLAEGESTLKELLKQIADIKELDTKVLHSALDMAKLKRKTLFSNQTEQLLSSKGNLLKSSHLKKILVGKHPSKEFIEIRLNAPQNNFVIIKEIHLTLVDIKEGKQEGEPILAYRNPRLSMLQHAQGILRNLTVDQMINDTMLEDELYDEFAVTPGEDLYNSTYFSNTDLERDTLASLTENEVKLLYIRDKYKKITNRVLDTGLGQSIWDEDIFKSLKEDPVKDDSYYDYGTRISLSKRTALTPHALFLKLEHLKNVKGKIFETNDKGSPKYQAYLHITTVKGDAMLVSDKFMDSSVTGEEMVSSYGGITWDIGNIVSEEKSTSAKVLPRIPKNKDEGSWISAASPSVTGEELFKQILPKHFTKAIKQTFKSMDETLEDLEKRIEELEKFGDGLNTLLADLQDLIALLQNQVLKALIKAIKALLNQPMPGIYLSLWKGDSTDLPSILVGAMRKKGIYRSTAGGAIFMMDSRTIEFILEFLKLSNEFSTFFSSFDLDSPYVPPEEKGPRITIKPLDFNFPILIPKLNLDLSFKGNRIPTAIASKIPTVRDDLIQSAADYAKDVHAGAGLEDPTEVNLDAPSQGNYEMVEVQIIQALEYIAKNKSSNFKVQANVSTFSLDKIKL